MKDIVTKLFWGDEYIAFAPLKNVFEKIGKKPHRVEKCSFLGIFLIQACAQGDPVGNRQNQKFFTTKVDFFAKLVGSYIFSAVQALNAVQFFRACVTQVRARARVTQVNKVYFLAKSLGSDFFQISQHLPSSERRRLNFLTPSCTYFDVLFFPCNHG